ncbi:MAG: transketolase [Elusimicrobia bacterium]|nr:transketolase [Elusimicrobiota bacterium]
MADVAPDAKELRADIIRMITAAGSGHPGGSLSIIDFLAVLYSKHLRHDPRRPDWPDRDRFVLSKGHAAPALYAVLARHGYFDRNLLSSLRKLGSPLQGHPERRRLPGIEASTGSLGQGPSIALGMALAAKLDGRGCRIYAACGDGEMQEGQVWEALMAAPKFQLDNLTLVVDCNDGQIDGHVHEVMPLEPLAGKLAAFNWEVRDLDGHDPSAIDAALDWAKGARGKPRALLARTVKGKGVSFMENQVDWHGRAPNQEQCAAALKEILGA